MKITIKESSKEKLIRKFDIVVSAEDIGKIRLEKLKNLGKETTLPGFRKGHAPLHVIEKKYEKSIITELLNDVIQEATKQLYTEQNLESVSDPKVSITKYVPDDDLEIKVELEVYPEISDIDYKSITINRNVVDITDKEINESIDQIAKHKSKNEDITEDRAIKSGDIAVINFKGFINDEEFKGGAGENHPLEIGSNSFIPGFEDQLIGKKSGDKVDVKVTFPETYHEKSLAGKEALFKVDILKIQQLVKPEVNDDLAKLVNVESLEVLKDDIRKKYEKQVKQLEKENLRKSLLEELAKTEDFALPQVLVSIETNAMWQKFTKLKEHIKSSHESEEHNLHNHSKEELELCKKSDEEVKAIHLKNAQNRVKVGLILNSIFRKNNLKVTEKDMESIMETEAMLYGATLEMMKQYYYQNKEALNSLRSRAMEDCILSYILDKINYNDKHFTFEEYTKSF